MPRPKRRAGGRRPRADQESLARYQRGRRHRLTPSDVASARTEEERMLARLEHAQDVGPGSAGRDPCRARMP